MAGLTTFLVGTTVGLFIGVGIGCLVYAWGVEHGSRERRGEIDTRRRRK